MSTGASLMLAGPDGAAQTVRLDDRGERLTIGRRASNDIVLDWDPEVSRVHAEIELVGGEWTIVDDGLSSNGSYVNDVRVTRRRRLRGGDRIRIGNTTLSFRSGARGQSRPTLVRGRLETPTLTDGQRRVLGALCAPCTGDRRLSTPATNREIAEGLHISVETVKSTLRALFVAFGVSDLPQNRKRAALVDHALDLGVVAPD